MSENSKRKEAAKKERKEVAADEKEIQRIQRGGLGGDNLSEMLAQWRDERREGLED